MIQFPLELSPTTSFAWQERQLHIFVPSSTDGIFPGAGVVFDSAGNLWGTTTSSLSGAGSVFKLSPSSSGTWTDSTFLFDNTDGYEPTAGLIFDAAGNLYGTTVSGGANTSYGVVFQIVPQARTLERADGSEPSAGLIFDAQGNLLGTTALGGDLTCNSGNGCGTVFRFSHSSTGWQPTVLHAFSGDADGARPYASVAQDAFGKIFGTTQEGGMSSVCCGTVFEIKP